MLMKKKIFKGIFYEKTHKKPFYKKVLRARYNLLNSSRVFKFKKKKWERFKMFARRKLRFFKRYRFHDQSRAHVQKFKNPGNKFKKRFRNNFTKIKGIQLMYGGFKKKKFKQIICSNKIKKYRTKGSSINTLLNFENRLDSILYKISFCKTIKQSQQMIKHGHVMINDRIARVSSAKLGFRDRVSIAPKSKVRGIVKLNLLNSKFWPIPPAFLKVNYKTLNAINIAKENGTEVIFLNYNLRIHALLTKNLKFKLI